MPPVDGQRRGMQRVEFLGAVLDSLSRGRLETLGELPPEPAIDETGDGDDATGKQMRGALGRTC